MEQRRSPRVPARAFGGAFHDYVRGVFADRSVRARLLRANRARWLREISRGPKVSIGATHQPPRD